MWRRLREDKIEQPLRRRSDGNPHLTDARGEDLAHVQPGHRAPRHVVHARLEVHHRYGGDRGRGDGRGVGVWREDLAQNGHDEHQRAHHERAADQRPLSTDPLDQEDDENEAGDDLDYAEEAADQEAVVAGADGFEDLRGIFTVLVVGPV